MQITDVRVRKVFDEGPMKAIVSVTFDNELALHDVKVINARDKYFVVMPSRKNPDGTYRDIVHPINAASRSMLETAVINAYFERLKEIEENPEAAAVSLTITSRIPALITSFLHIMQEQTPPTISPVFGSSHAIYSVEPSILSRSAAMMALASA